MRHILNQNAPVTIGVAALVIVVCLILLISNLFFSSDEEEQRILRKGGVPQAYFYDRNTGELFTMPVHVSGPIERDSGDYNGEPAGVRAHVFACGDCGSNENFIAWLERPSPREKELEEGKLLTETDLYPLVSVPGNDNWYAANTREGLGITEAAQKRCPEGQKPNYCQPPAAIE